VTRQCRPAYTLFELILAIALSATLLVLIGTAINLYLVRVDNSRQRVEESQLARSILAMIAADLRASAVYQPQDTSAVAQLAANATPFDVDEIDQPGGNSGSNSGSNGNSGGSSSSFGDVSAGASGESSASSDPDATNELPLGINGTLEELIVDVSRLPRVDELLTPVATGTAAMVQSATATGGLPRPSDEKTIRYFIRQGEQIEPASAAATSLAPEDQLRAGGLVRQEIDRAARTWAEKSGNQAVLDSGQALVAPEVVQARFRYFGGDEVTETWDMRERQSLPVAVEVTIWLRPATTDGAAANLATWMNDPAAMAHQYQQTVYLPVTAATSSGEGHSGGGESGSQSSSGDQSNQQGNQQNNDR